MPTGLSPLSPLFPKVTPKSCLKGFPACHRNHSGTHSIDVVSKPMLFIELFNNAWLGSIASTSAGKRVYNYCITYIYIDIYIYRYLNWSSELVLFLMFPACWNSSLAVSASLRCSMARSGTRVWFLMWLSRSSTTRPAPSPQSHMRMSNENGQRIHPNTFLMPKLLCWAFRCPCHHTALVIRLETSHHAVAVCC